MGSLISIPQAWSASDANGMGRFGGHRTHTKERIVTRVAIVQKELLMLTRIRELARCLVLCARRKVERDRVQTVALQHATDTLDHVTVDTFDLTRLEGARWLEPVSYTHLTLPTMLAQCRSRWSPYH